MATAKITELNETNTCHFCENALAKYSCPRCNVQYCSVNCYKSEKHLQCSETFYENCVKEELALNVGDEEMKTKMEEILHRFNTQSFENQECPDGCLSDTSSNDSDDDECENLVERFKNIDLDKESPDKIWSKLTKDEQQEFMAFLRSGDISKLIPPWEPWWIQHSDKKIVELDCDDDKDYKKRCPRIVHIKHFSSLSTKAPSDCVTYNLINVLASYVLTLRYFNGEIYDFVKEAATCMISLSACLKVNENFNDFDTAVKSVEQACLNTQWVLVDDENIKKMREDVHHILKGPSKNDRKYYTLCALSDFHVLIIQALKKKSDEEEVDSFSKKFPNDNLPKVHLESKEKMRQCLRKIDYFLSYTKDCFIFK